MIIFCQAGCLFVIVRFVHNICEVLHIYGSDLCGASGTHSDAPYCGLCGSPTPTSAMCTGRGRPCTTRWFNGPKTASPCRGSYFVVGRWCSIRGLVGVKASMGLTESWDTFVGNLPHPWAVGPFGRYALGICWPLSHLVSLHAYNNRIGLLLRASCCSVPCVEPPLAICLPRFTQTCIPAENWAQLAGMKRQNTAVSAASPWQPRWGHAVAVIENRQAANAELLPLNQRTRLFVLGGETYVTDDVTGTFTYGGSGQLNNDVWRSVSMGEQMR